MSIGLRRLVRVARLLHKGEWFEALSSYAILEGEYERLILSNADQLFPDLHAVSFKKPLAYNGEIRTPDLALIDREYRSWWVVEVELSHHSLWGDVVPQVEVFSHARYGQEEARYLADRNDRLERDRLTAMMKGAAPQVLVIVDNLPTDWHQALSRLDVRTTVIELFRSDRLQHIVRLNGDYPSTLADVVSVCRFDPLLPRALLLDSPAGVVVDENSEVLIEYSGDATWWRRLEMQDGVWLTQLRGTPIPKPPGRMEIRRRDDGRLVFHCPTTRRQEGRR